MQNNYPEKDGKIWLTLKVQPQAGKNCVLLTGDNEIKIKVTSPPENGEANQNVIKVLSKWTGIRKSAFCLVLGMTSRIKTVTFPLEFKDLFLKSLEQLRLSQNKK